MIYGQTEINCLQFLIAVVKAKRNAGTNLMSRQWTTRSEDHPETCLTALLI
jgi:hypothetical protein